jgi:dCMP deaminase
MRYSRENMFMEMARAASKRSTCCRLNVGALVVLHNNPVSVGYNGAPPKQPHCGGDDCPGMVPGQCPSIHAEANALRKACELVDAGQSVDLYLTHSPCSACSFLIRECDLYIKRILFEVPYRSTQHLSMFHEEYPSPLLGAEDLTRSTEVYEVAPSGYITEYFTRRVVKLP